MGKMMNASSRMTVRNERTRVRYCIVVCTVCFACDSGFSSISPTYSPYTPDATWRAHSASSFSPKTGAQM